MLCTSSSILVHLGSYQNVALLNETPQGYCRHQTATTFVFHMPLCVLNIIRQHHVTVLIRHLHFFFVTYSNAANPNNPAPIAPGIAVMSGAIPELAAVTALERLLVAELASLETLEAFELAELLRLAAAEVSVPAEDTAEDSSELMDEDTDAAEEVIDAAAEEADEMTVATLAAALSPELLPVPDGCTCASAGPIAAMARTSCVVRRMMFYVVV